MHKFQKNNPRQISDEVSKWEDRKCINSLAQRERMKYWKKEAKTRTLASGIWAQQINSSHTHIPHLLSCLYRLQLIHSQDPITSEFHYCHFFCSSMALPTFSFPCHLFGSGASDSLKPTSLPSQFHGRIDHKNKTFKVGLLDIYWLVIIFCHVFWYNVFQKICRAGEGCVPVLPCQRMGSIMHIDHQHLCWTQSIIQSTWKISQSMWGQQSHNNALHLIQAWEHAKLCSMQELKQLADELRSDVIFQVSKTGGHLGSSLGVVELTVALHHVFNAPQDKILWDVGHQVPGTETS